MYRVLTVSEKKKYHNKKSIRNKKKTHTHRFQEKRKLCRFPLFWPLDPDLDP